jgi:hypothetical protein
MNECVTMKFNIDNSNSKVGISVVNAILKRKLYLKCRNGLATYRETNMITLPLTGCSPGDKIDEKVVQFDLNAAKDIGTPANLGGALAEFAGKIQQTCNGQLINVKYELHISAVIDGCLCCDNNPYVFTPIEILAPERLLIFMQYVYPDVAYQPEYAEEYADGVPAPGYQQNQNAGYPQNQNGGYPQAPSPYAQNPQSQYAGAQPVGELQSKGTKNHLHQKNMDDTPVDGEISESSEESV